MPSYYSLTLINLSERLVNYTVLKFEQNYNMKKWITAGALLVVTCVNAQQKEGTIVYEKKMNMHRTIQNEQMKSFMPEFRTSKHLLLFSDSISMYKMIPEEEAPDPFGGGGGAMVMRFGGSDGGELYKNYAQQKGLQTNEMGGKNFLIIDTLKQIPWKLTEETKKILGFTCYKATMKTKSTRQAMRISTISSSGTIDTTKMAPTAPKEIEVIAWYTNDIVTPAGPENHSMLPGVILEVDVDNGLTVFKALEVKTTLNKKELKEPTKGKLVSKAEYQKLMMDMMGQGAGPGMFQMRGGNN
jgi:GLPGLI family protein